MSSISKVSLNKITDEGVIEMLRAVIPALETAGIDYFVVGAFARDVELWAKGHNLPPARKTNDIDLAVMVGSPAEYEDLKDALAALPEFEPCEDKPYRFIFRKQWDVDFLPFGEIADEKGRVEIRAKTVFVLDMPGFDSVHPFVETVETEEGLTLRISSLPGVVFLKLLAWQDSPGREKDIHDIAYILNNFLELHWDELADIFDCYADEIKIFKQLVSARYIGRQISIMLENHSALQNRLLHLLEKESKGFNMARLMSRDVEDNQKIIQALYDGFTDKTGKA